MEGHPLMDMAKWNSLTNQNTRDNGKIIKWMGKVFIHGPMETTLRDNIIGENVKEGKEFIH